MIAEQSDATKSIQWASLSSVSAGIEPIAEGSSQPNASSGATRTAEKVQCKEIANSPSDLDFENFLLRTPEYEEVGMRASEIPLPGDGANVPNVAMEVEVQEESMQREQSRRTPTKQRSSGKKLKRR